MKTAILDIHAPIIPGEGIGNLKLDMSIDDLTFVLDEIRQSELGVYEKNADYTYYNLGDMFGLQFDSNDTLSQIGILANYPGTLFGAIRPGMKLSEIMRLEPRLFYDESEDAFFIEGVPGIVLEMDFPPLDPLENPELTTLYSIIVYRPEDFHIAKIYIPLLDEGVSVVRPTQAEWVKDDIFKVLPTDDYDPDNEHWQFPPGTLVICEPEIREDKALLVAQEEVVISG